MRIGWTNPFDRAKEMADDVAAAARYAGEQAIAKIDPRCAEAEDAAAIARISDAIRRRDEPAVAAELERASPRLVEKLWQADLPPWVPPGQTLDTLQTEEGEAWRVKWAYGFDAGAAMDRLIRNWMPFAKGLGDVHRYVKKAFPREQQKPGAGALAGGTTFGYDPGRPGSGTFTPNDIRMTEVRNERTGKPMPVALMTYSERPWFVKETGTGFNDEFKALTPNIILARGRYSVYADENLHGRAAGGRPPLSTALSKLAGGERKGPAPDVISFWMYRMKDGDPRESPVFGAKG
jgi:hypothetical protein